MDGSIRIFCAALRTAGPAGLSWHDPGVGVDDQSLADPFQLVLDARSPSEAVARAGRPQSRKQVAPGPGTGTELDRAAGGADDPAGNLEDARRTGSQRCRRAKSWPADETRGHHAETDSPGSGSTGTEETRFARVAGVADLSAAGGLEGGVAFALRASSVSAAGGSSGGGSAKPGRPSRE